LFIFGKQRRGFSSVAAFDGGYFPAPETNMPQGFSPNYEFLIRHPKSCFFSACFAAQNALFQGLILYQNILI